MSNPAFWLRFWLAIGFLGQGLFTARFLVQWLASERRGNSVVPVSFWWLSLLGGGALLSYAISRRDPVITVGQTMGILVYVRNLMLLRRAQLPVVQMWTVVSKEAVHLMGSHTAPLPPVATTSLPPS